MPMPAHLKGNYFEKIMVTATNLTIKMRPSGQKYFYRKNDGPLKKCDYGEEITVAVGESLTIIGRDDNITFAPLPDAIKRYGFEVKEEIDHRSVGKEKLTTKIFMVTSKVEGAQELRDGVVALLEPSTAAVEKLIIAESNKEPAK